MELMGDEKDRICEYACGRNFEVLKWAHNELDLPWAPYPAGRVDDDVLVLRVLREIDSELEGRWPEDEGPEEWDGVTMINGRVVDLELEDVGPQTISLRVPAEIGQLTSLRELHLSSKGQLTVLGLHERGRRRSGSSRR